MSYLVVWFNKWVRKKQSAEKEGPNSRYILDEVDLMVLEESDSLGE